MNTGNVFMVNFSNVILNYGDHLQDLFHKLFHKLTFLCIKSPNTPPPHPKTEM